MFSRLEVWLQSHWAKMKVSMGLWFFQWLQGRICFLAFFFLPFKLLVACGNFLYLQKPTTQHRHPFWSKTFLSLATSSLSTAWILCKTSCEVNNLHVLTKLNFHYPSLPSCWEKDSGLNGEVLLQEEMVLTKELWKYQEEPGEHR